MKKYNVKVNFKGNYMEYTDCYFISTLDEYRDYMLLLNNKFLVSETEIKNLKTLIGHGHSFLTGLSGLFCGMIEDKEKREPTGRFIEKKVNFVSKTELEDWIKIQPEILDKGFYVIQFD